MDPRWQFTIACAGLVVAIIGQAFWHAAKFAKANQAIGATNQRLLSLENGQTTQDNELREQRRLLENMAQNLSELKGQFSMFASLRGNDNRQ